MSERKRSKCGQYYAVVTNDKYELPVIVGRVDEVADYLGIKIDTVYTYLSRGRSTTNDRRYRIVKLSFKGR